MKPDMVSNVTKTGKTDEQVEENDAETKEIPLNGHIEKSRNTVNAMLHQETNNDRKKLRSGKYVNTEDTTRNGSLKQRRQTKKSVKSRDNGITGEMEVEAEVPILALDEINGDSKQNLESNQKESDSSNESQDNILKKIKTEDCDASNTVEYKAVYLKSNNVQPKCEYCNQNMTSADIKIYPGHPNDAVEEMIALIDPKLSLFTGEEAMVDEGDERPQNKVTHFCVYDKNGHLCPFDTGLIEKNVVLYFSGYMKPIYEENSCPEGGVPTKDMGPINEWYVSGFDGGELALIGFSTAYGEYILMEPAEAYTPFMDAVKEKIYMSKIVIEFLLDETTPTYEDLLNKLQTIVPPNGLSRFTEDSLLRHAQFICDQVISFDDSAKPEDPLLITTPCMRAVVSLAGVTLNKRFALRRTQSRDPRRKRVVWTKATTTKLVSNMFETFFSDQIVAENNKGITGPKRQRCGVCEHCQQPDCGVCSACKDMVKFGGNGKGKQACNRRRCPNMAIQEANDSDQENDELNDSLIEDTKITQKMILKEFKHVEKEISWVGELIINDGRRTFYKSVMLVDEEIKISDYVLVESNDPTVPLQIAKVIYMWEDTRSGAKLCHANWFRRGSDTVLGETSHPAELFVLDECDNVPFTSIKSKAIVTHKTTPKNWNQLGNADLTTEDYIQNKDVKTFFYQKKYIQETARFEDPPLDPVCPREEISHRFCPACVRFNELQSYYTPKVFGREEEKNNKEVTYSMVKYKGEEFRVGSAVFLLPTALKYKYTSTYHVAPKAKKGNVDEDMYPEYYRKSSDHVKGSNYDTPEPFHIGYINSIYAKTNNQLVASSDIWININKLYRPENTHKGLTLMQQVDLNMVYWSDEICNVKFTEVAGKCYLIYVENLNQPIEEWTAAGPYRFYFSQAYNVLEETFVDPPDHVMNIGKSVIGKGKGKSKCKSKKSETNDKKIIDNPVDYNNVPRKLKMLDVFSGCGGLSEGLRQAGIVDNRWAIENEEIAACAYRLNNPDTTVFCEDCNTLLQKVIKGYFFDGNWQRLPQKGDVEILCGCPPCQGFSGMNRFNSRQYSIFKNSLVVSCLSYCDYYRPKFFVMENVRNFVSFKRSMVLKLTLSCLVRMGYQCTFGILQAGNYGVPQTRRRLIILAAAPGETLPKFPEPTHVFSKRACQLSVVVDNKKYSSNCDWGESAPYRTISVRDAMYDLPSISNGWHKEEIAYGDEPMSHFQRKVRSKEFDVMLRDHICKDMAPLVEARIAHIPTASGSDWRDLPNIVVRLSDGTFAKKLEYNYNDKKAGKSSTGALRGVCCCSEGRMCDPMDRQYNTLIPWCLPHTGSRHNQWAGLYGRLEWDGFFGTTITNPEPMGKQGRVLHPEQTRVVSVRECARSQGFPDSFRFYGNVLDKHRQIGNAVPPPLGAALGLEIRKCLKDANIEQVDNKMEDII